MNRTYISPEFEVFEISLELFTGSVLGKKQQIDDWDNEDFPDETL